MNYISYFLLLSSFLLLLQAGASIVRLIVSTRMYLDWKLQLRKSERRSLRQIKKRVEDSRHLKKEQKVNKPAVIFHSCLIGLLILGIARAAFASSFESLAECNANHDAAELTIFQWVQRAAVCESNIWPATCDVQTDFRDGANGALWKPVSESKGTPVILLPASYAEDVESMQVKGPGGEFASQVNFRSCCSNGNRSHWDVEKPASQLPFELRVLILFKDGRTECRYVENPNIRED